MIQIGYITKNSLGNRVYDVNGVGATISSQTGGLGGRGVSLILENKYRDEERELTADKVTEEIGKDSEKQFTYASLFSGIGGFEFGLNAVGGQCIFASEFDKFAAKSYETLHGYKPHGDITEIDAKDIPDHEVLVGGFPCFVEGTLITTNKGIKKIEEIRKGDQVLTHTNSFKPVVIPMKKKKRGIYNIKIQGSPFNKVTEEHPYYVREMYRTYKRENGKRTNKRNWTEPKWVKAKDLVKGKHFVGFSENKESKNPYEITQEESWLIGRYVADGYLRLQKDSSTEKKYSDHVVYCVGKAKLSEFESAFESYSVKFSEDRTAFKGRVYGEKLVKLCELVGRGSENKVVPGYILDLPNDLLEKFLEGYISGDGCETNNGFQATSVSKKLIYGLAQVVQKLYRTPYTIQYHERPKTTVIEGRTVNQKDTWMLRFRKDNRKQQDAVYIDGMLWNPIRSIEYDEDFEGIVYNFEVEEDNSYVANNTTVHNCQSFSVAGKRGGFEDTRGTMFFQAARIASEKKPKVILLENVKGLVGHNSGKTLDTIVKTLNDIGYRVDFEILNSKFFGVPQSRERIFIVAIREDLVDNEPWIIQGNTVVPKGKRRISGYEDVKTYNFNWPTNDTVTTKLKDILEENVDEKYYISEEKTKQLVEQLTSDETVIMDVSQRGREGKARLYYDTAPTVTARDYKEPRMVGHVDIKGHDAIKRVYDPEHVGTTLTTMGGGHREPKIVEGAADRTRNGSKRLERNGEEYANALTSVQHDSLALEIPQIRVRKLTPKECFRLQGFTDEQHDLVEQAGISNSQRYKQAGNAVTVNVIEALGKKLVNYIN